MQERIIEFSNVTKSYEGRYVLKNISFSIKKGEYFIIAGGSGSGKTTILKVLLGITEYDSGSVKFFGKEVGELKEEELNILRRRVGMVFQSGGLFDSLTVGENIGLPLYENILRKRNILEEDELGILKKVKEVLKLVDLEGTEEMMPSELSGGMMRRVAIARALVTDPELIIYDEPLMGLDPITANTITKYILHLRQKLGSTSIFVAHNLRFAMKVADRIMVLQEGRKVFEGAKEDFLKSQMEYVVNLREAGL